MVFTDDSESGDDDVPSSDEDFKDSEDDYTTNSAASLETSSEDESSKDNDITTSEASLDTSSDDRSGEDDEDIADLEDFNERLFWSADRRQEAIDNENTLQEDIILLSKMLKDLETPEALKKLYPPRLSGVDLPDQGLCDETETLKELLRLEDNTSCPTTADDNDFYEVQLDDFHIFRSPDNQKGHQGQYENASLIPATVHSREDQYVIEGVIKTHGLEKRILAYITNLSIGGIDDLKEVSVKNLVWIQTEVSSAPSHDCWYRLNAPSAGYKSWWVEFLWLADFAKHFLDYIFQATEKQENVGLNDFRHLFWNKLRDLHEGRNALQLADWHEKCGTTTDFRQHVLTHVDFLRDTAWTSLRHDEEAVQRVFDHKVWNDCSADLTGDRESPNTKDEPTVVSEHVARSFLELFPAWNELKLLETVRMCAEVEASRAQQKQKFGFPSKLDVNQKDHFVNQIPITTTILQQASKRKPTILRNTQDLLDKFVVVRKKDKKSGSYDFLYAWVRKINSEFSVNVVWLVEPKQTLCASGKYPIGNELFFSNACNCETVHVRSIVHTIPASVFRDRASVGHVLFAHSMYYEGGSEAKHVTANDAMVQCHCKDRFYRQAKKAPSTPRHHDNKSPLTCMGLFSGMGQLEFGMASTKQIKMVCAIESWATPAATYRANDEGNQTEVLNCSVNPVLKKIMQGERPINHVGCIGAGCPCQGFSLLNAHRDSIGSQRNVSLLANLLSWFEVILPQYGIIENVPNMDPMPSKGAPKPNACAQAICHLVALGYQVRKCKVKVSNIGGASQRTRLIIMIAAPDVKLPADLQRTYDSQTTKPKVRTCYESIRDLPPLSNDKTLNIIHPTHVPVHRLKIDFQDEINYRHLVEQIPTDPPGLGLALAFHRGLFTKSQRSKLRSLFKERIEKSSKCLKRIKADQPFRTVCTLITPMDKRFGGEILHPLQHRTLSIREVCRAMDLPDWFLIVGNSREQYKQLGNGVPWVLGAAIGRAIGDAWAASASNDQSQHGPVQVPGLISPASRSTPSLQTFMNMSPRTPVSRPNSVLPVDPVHDQRHLEVKTEALDVSDLTPLGRTPRSSTKRAARVIMEDSDDSDIEIVMVRPVAKRPRQT